MNDTAAGDIIDITDGVFDAQGHEVDIREYRRDTVLLEDSGAARPLTAFGVKYLKPFKFIVLSQKPSKEDVALVSAHSGDALCVFPYAFNVSEGDVMTVLSGTQTRKIVQKCRGQSHDDTIPDFFVDRVSRLETGEREYTEGQDFIIVGANKIHWIGENRPDEGAICPLSIGIFPRTAWQRICLCCGQARIRRFRARLF